MQTTKEAIKQTAHEATKLQNVNMDDKESVIQHAKGVLKEHTRIEALRLNEEITMRQALMTSLTPEQRERALQQLKMPPIVTAPAAKPDRFTLPISVIDYRVLRPPFAAYYAVPSPAYNIACVTAGREAGLNRRFAEGIAAEGALSIEAAIGEWFNVECWPDGSWFIGEANQASAAMGLIHDNGQTFSSPVYLFVEADFVLEGTPSPWTYYMFPGEPSSGLGLVGVMGIANMVLYAITDNETSTRGTYERFLLGSAAAYSPPQVDVKTSFTLSQWIVIPPSSLISRYAIHLEAEATAFRSIPVQGGGYPGYAQTNMTVPGSKAAMGPCNPLKVKEVRASLIMF